VPYGIPDSTWNRLPPDDQAAIIAASKGQTPPAPTSPSLVPTTTAPAVAPPTQATTAPPPNLTAGSGAANAVTSELNDADDALVPPGVNVPTRPGVTLIPATPIAPPPGASTTATQPTPATAAPPQDLSGDVLVPKGLAPAARPGVTLISATPAFGGPPSPSKRTLAAVPGPGEEGPHETEPFPAWLKGLKDALDKTHYGEAPGNVSKAFQAWVKTHWLGAPYTPTQLHEAFSLARTEVYYPRGQSFAEAFARTSPPGTPNPFAVVVYSPYDASSLLRRAFAIQKDLDRTTSQVAAAHLEGALSAVGLVLAIVDSGALYKIPDAGRYVGVGPPATSLQATLQDVLESAGEATRPRR
jgi:hypothetical protein